ncbi:Predicted transcriptional regulators [Ochrobactrum soli]|uniref:Predicted transcriptional regulators n=1 Tax=Ochrobactrum soli TaxID=2448455 RepID=A0A2P9HB95_9HYPH|nr:Predicted transcriptional regulators [[Ochrobactrum] soli]
MVLKAHEPYPAIAVDKGWNMVLANAAIAPLLKGVEEPALLSPPVNVLRLSLHPKGLAPFIANFDEWRTHLIERLRIQIDATADPALETLEKELSAYPGRPRANPQPYDVAANIAVPLRLRIDGELLSFISTITVFGTPLDATLSELAVESFFPADGETGEILRRLTARS